MGNPIDLHDLLRRIRVLEASVDLVEKLPDEGDAIRYGDGTREFKPSISQMAMKPRHEWPVTEPTAEARDRKRYPVEWFAVQQRFEDVTPPEDVDLQINVINSERAVKCPGKKYRWVCGVLKFWSVGYWIPSAMTLDAIAWTLAPIPPKAKEEANVWDEFIPDNDGLFNINGIFWWGEERFKQKPKMFLALAAYIQHILSKEKG